MRVLELKYHKWLRPGYNDDFLPPLLALSWSREKTATPLQCHVHYKTSAHSWEPLNLPRAQVIGVLSCLRITQDGQVTQLSLKTNTWKSAIFENALVIPFLSRLQVLQITNHIFAGEQVVNVLPSFHELRVLELSSVCIPPLDFDLPLVHTLQRLSLWHSTLAWMDGLVFTKLQKFSVDEYGWPETFKQKVGMPVCTHIVFQQDKLETLPILQSNFHFPLLNTYELQSMWKLSGYDKGGISALQQIHVKVFRFRIVPGHPLLLELLGSKDEVEQLDLEFYSRSSFPAVEYMGFLTWFSATNPITSNLFCPNMKVLRLHFSGIRNASRKEVIQSCMRMMNNRRLAGHSLDKCYIWWDLRDWVKAASLVLVMEDETVRIEG